LELIDKTDKWASLGVLLWAMLRLGLVLGVHHDVVPYVGPVKMLVPPPPGSPAARAMAQQMNGNQPQPQDISGQQNPVG
jgi:hypothetical protein